MSFCPICKGNHDSDIMCVNQKKQIQRDIGIDKVNDNRRRNTIRDKIALYIIYICIASVILMTIIRLVSIAFTKQQIINNF